MKSLRLSTWEAPCSWGPGRSFYTTTGAHDFFLSRGDPSSRAVRWPGCVTLLSMMRLELMPVAQLMWPHECASRSSERHLSGGKKECASPAYFHLGPRYNKTRIASWTKVEPSWELLLLREEVQDHQPPRVQSILPSHHQDKLESLWSWLDLDQGASGERSWVLKLA